MHLEYGDTNNMAMLKNVEYSTFFIPLNLYITAPSAWPAAPDRTEDVTETSKCSHNIVPRYLYLSTT